MGIGDFGLRNETSPRRRKERGERQVKVKAKHGNLYLQLSMLLTCKILVFGKIFVERRWVGLSGFLPTVTLFDPCKSV